MSDETKQLCSNAYTCEWCGAYSTIHTCSGCKEARYCGKSCQASHWAEHRGLCQQIQAERAKKENRKKLGEALCDASLRGKAPEVRTLLASGADPWYRVEEGQNKGYFPLYAASQEGHVEVIQALVAAGADPNQVGGELTLSSLYVAAQFNQPRAIAALARAGADVNLASSQGCTPLNIAVQRGNREAVVAL
jgi:ankyrin repeat protein